MKLKKFFLLVKLYRKYNSRKIRTFSWFKQFYKRNKKFTLEELQTYL